MPAAFSPVAVKAVRDVTAPAKSGRNTAAEDGAGPAPAAAAPPQAFAATGDLAAAGAARPAQNQPSIGAEPDADGAAPPPLPPGVTSIDQAVRTGPLAEATPAPPAAPPTVDAAQVRTLPPVQLPSPDHRGRTVTARVELALDGAGSRVRIDLEPADLGRVEVALRLDDNGTAAATFTVDRPETLQLLQRDARVVNEMLSAAGFSVDQRGLDFTLRDSGGRAGDGERRFGQKGRGDPGSAASAPPGTSAPRSRRGLLDLQV